MHVRTGRPAGIANGCNALTTSDPLANLDVVPGVVAIDGAITISMIEDHDLTVTGFGLDAADNPVGRSSDRGPGPCCDVEAFMHLASAVERITPHAE